MRGKYIRTEELRQKMRLKRTGTKMSDEAKLKMSLVRKGKIRSVEAKTKIRLGCLLRFHSLEKAKEMLLNKPITSRERNIQLRYGENRYDELFSSQNGVCKICGKPETMKGRKFLSMDHNHITGKIRGLLCYRCNLAIGLLFEDTTNLQKAIDYLNFYK